MVERAKRREEEKRIEAEQKKRRAEREQLKLEDFELR
jgi:hypothetical protein